MATYNDPEAFSFDVASFTENPFYKFTQQEGSGRVLANASVTGSRQSGAALKALQDRGQATAYQWYAPERDAAYSRHTDNRNFLRSKYESDRGFEYGVSRDARGDYESDRGFEYGQSRDARGDYETDRTFDYGINRDERDDYENDRNYLTNRYDRTTDDLFRYTNLGQTAAGVVSNAAVGQGTNLATSYRNDGETRASDALNQGDIWGGLAGDLGGYLVNYLNRRGGGYGPSAD